MLRFLKKGKSNFRKGIKKLNIIKSFSSTSVSELDYEKFRGFKNRALLDLEIEGVTIVKDKKSAEKALGVLKQHKDR